MCQFVIFVKNNSLANLPNINPCQMFAPYTVCAIDSGVDRIILLPRQDTLEQVLVVKLWAWVKCGRFLILLHTVL